MGGKREWGAVETAPRQGPAAGSDATARRRLPRGASQTGGGETCEHTVPATAVRRSAKRGRVQVEHLARTFVGPDARRRSAAPCRGAVGLTRRPAASLVACAWESQAQSRARRRVRDGTPRFHEWKRWKATSRQVWGTATGLAIPQAGVHGRTPDRARAASRRRRHCPHLRQASRNPSHPTGWQRTHGLGAAAGRGAGRAARSVVQWRTSHIYAGATACLTRSTRTGQRSSPPSTEARATARGSTAA